MPSHRLQCAGGQVLVLDAEVVMSLRKEYRIVGSLEGSHPTNPLQNRYFALPLVLLPEEAAMLSETGVVEFEGDEFVWPESEHDRLRFALYKDLHRQGYYVDRGIKYGGDYLLYPGDPLRHHSSHVVTLLERKHPFKPRELVPLGRVGTAVKKARLLSSWNPETGQFSHITMNWSAM